MPFPRKWPFGNGLPAWSSKHFLFSHLPWHPSLAYQMSVCVTSQIDRYNKRVEDFTSLREYNDYLEEVEDMIVNLSEGIDTPAIEMRIAQYQRENAEQIMNAQARKAEEYAAALAASRGLLVQTGVDVSSSSQAGSNNGTQGHYAPALAGAGNAQPRPTGMAPQPLPLGSSHEMLGLEYEDEEMMKLRGEKAARAGGWSIEMTRKRALEEAFASIWI